MKEDILSLFDNSDKSYLSEDILNELKIKDAEKIREVLDILQKLEHEGILYRSNKDKYLLLENSHLLKGVISINKKGFGFVEIEGVEDVYIDEKDLGGAINGDTVVLELKKKTSGKKEEGRIVKVIKHSDLKLVGEYKINKKKKGYIELDDKKMDFEVIIDEVPNGVVEGSKVLVNILKQINNKKYKGVIEAIIGHKDDAGIDILSIAYKYNFFDKFSDDTIKALEDIPNEVEMSEYKNRRDLRNYTIFTIDGDDTKDIDDAIHIKKLENGNYELGVHIADVSHYVKETSPLDIDAYERGTSVYLVDKVLPMIPHQLSNGICSLNEGVDRLTLSCVMEIDSQGKTVSHEIFESIINSKKKMTYNAVNDILENDFIEGGYEDYIKDLSLMLELSKVLGKMKDKRGYIHFPSNEVKILVDDKGIPIEIVKREQKTGEKIIEDFMIQANETVATHIYYMDLPFLYRIHDKPKEEKLNEFMTFSSSLGYRINKRLLDPKPKDIADALHDLKDVKEYFILADLMLRSMKKAIYSSENIGHFGLGSTCYTHFTSPIRRYPDLTVHRLLKKYLFKNQINNEVIREQQSKLVVIGEVTSEREKSSVECEREVDDMKMAEYMENHIGEEYEGMISGVVNYGLYVQLPNLIEGLVHVSDIKGDYYTFDEASKRLVGDKNKVGYRLGDTVKVKVKRASKEEKIIDFELS